MSGASAAPADDPGGPKGTGPYKVEFVRVPPGEMDERLGLAMVVRRGDYTTVYCRADHITAELAGNLTETGTAFSRATIRIGEPMAPKINIVFERLDPDEMPDGILTPLSAVKGGKSVTYLRSDMITDAMCRALELVCGEQTRYLLPIPAIVPAAIRRD